MSDIIKTKKAIFDLLQHQITWNWSQLIWFKDHSVAAIKKHYLVKILTSAKEFVFPHNVWALFLSPTIAATFFLSHLFVVKLLTWSKKNLHTGDKESLD